MKQAIDCFKNLHTAATNARGSTNVTHEQELAAALQAFSALMIDELEGARVPESHASIAGAAFGDEEPTGLRMAQGDRIAELERELAAARAELESTRVELTEARRVIADPGAQSA